MPEADRDEVRKSINFQKTLAMIACYKRQMAGLSASVPRDYLRYHQPVCQPPQVGSTCHRRNPRVDT